MKPACTDFVLVLDLEEKKEAFVRPRPFESNRTRYGNWKDKMV